MKIKFLGTGTSQGVPVIGCSCPVCLSKNHKNKRLRSSAMITTDNEKKILIDCGPDFRQQMLNTNESKADAILITHEHNDHIIGLDDLRPLIFSNERNMPIYCHKRVKKEIQLRFPYAFSKEKYPGAPALELYTIDEGKDFEIEGTNITPLSVLHGALPILGYKFGNLAYITDANHIPDSEIKKLKNLDFLILNCIRKDQKHHSHFILRDILEIYERTTPKKIYLTHISHQFGLQDIEEQSLPENIRIAYDGLEFFF